MKTIRTSLTLPLKDAEMIAAVLIDVGTTKLRQMKEVGLAGTGGVGCIELQLATQLAERVAEIRQRNSDVKEEALKESMGSPMRPQDNQQEAVR